MAESLCRVNVSALNGSLPLTRQTKISHATYYYSPPPHTQMLNKLYKTGDIYATVLSVHNLFRHLFLVQGLWTAWVAELVLSLSAHGVPGVSSGTRASFHGSESWSPLLHCLQYAGLLAACRIILKAEEGGRGNNKESSSMEASKHSCASVILGEAFREGPQHAAVPSCLQS